MTLNRPERLSAFTEELHSDLRKALQAAGEDAAPLAEARALCTRLTALSPVSLALTKQTLEAAGAVQGV